jgi:hypothetical protein
MNELVPTRIVDRNGKITTVHKRTMLAPSGRTRLEKVVLTDPATKECEALFAAVDKRLIEMGLGFGTNRRSGLLGCSHTMPKEQLQQTLRLLNSYLADQLLVDHIQRQNTRFSEQRFGQWLAVMDRTTSALTEMNDYGDVARSPKYTLSAVSEAIMGVMALKENNEVARDFTDEQVDGLVMTTLVVRHLRGTGLRINSYSDVYDDHTEHHTTAVMDLYLRHPESLDHIEGIADTEGIVRFTELEQIMDEQHPTALISGVL